MGYTALDWYMEWFSYKILDNDEAKPKKRETGYYNFFPEDEDTFTEIRLSITQLKLIHHFLLENWYSNEEIGMIAGQGTLKNIIDDMERRIENENNRESFQERFFRVDKNNNNK